MAQRFVLLETPGGKQLETCLRTDRLPKTLLESSAHWSVLFTGTILVVSLVVALLVNGLKLGVQWDHQRWEEMLLVRPAYVCIPLLLPMGFMLLTLLDACGHARLLGLFETIQKTLRKRREDVFYDDEDDAESKQAPASLPLSVQLTYTAALLFSANYPLWSPPQLAQRLGSISVLCCVNKEGVLTDSVSYIDKISVLSPTAAPSASSEDAEPARQVLILELSRDPGRRKGRFRFNDLNWQETHLVRLKPLGLNCLLNTRCTFGGYAGTQSIRRLHCGDKISGDNRRYQRWDQCLCLLGKEIGFAEGALDSYVPLREIHLWRAAPERRERRPVSMNPQQQQHERREQLELLHMISVPVYERSREVTQLFCKGDPALVLDYCSLAFDGTEIKTLTADEKAHILELQKQWGSHNCIAFSFKVVSDQLVNLFACDALDGPQPIDSLSDAARGMFGTLLTRPTLVLFDGMTHSRVVALAEEALETLHSDQIFIGMITLRQLPRYEVQQAASKRASVRLANSSEYRSLLVTLTGSGGDRGHERRWCTIRTFHT